MRIRLVIGSLIVLVAVAPALGGTPLGTGFTYQGQLKQSGVPLEGTADFQFTLWDAVGSGDPPTGGTQVGGLQAIDALPVTAGLFTVTLNPGGEFGVDALDGNARWLQIAVRSPAGGGVFATLAPRQPLTATPHTLFSKNADLLDGLNSTAFLQAVPNPLSLSGASGGHIIRGTNSSTQAGATGVFGRASGASGPVIGVSGVTLSAEGVGVQGEAIVDGAAIGGKFVSQSTSGIGVFGQVHAFNGASYAGYFFNESDAGTGLYASVNSPTGPTYGGQFLNSSNAGIGVQSSVSSPTGNTFGGKFVNNSNAGIGVHASVPAATGGTIGGQFVSGSTSGVGVIGLAGASSGEAQGVAGLVFSTHGYGVYGQAMVSGPNNWGVFSQGRLGASGTKPFRIDHPDDPANKYLLHYAAESPEVINFYSGKATLDAAGEAVIELPHYFAKINRDPRYTLTAVGAPMPMLHVAEEIDEAALSAGATAGPGVAAPACTFRIAGGAPGAKVSWEVKALRNDLWCRNCAEPVEVEKQGREKGTYQHPEFYGQPPEMGTNYDAERQRPSPATSPEITPD